MSAPAGGEGSEDRSFLDRFKEFPLTSFAADHRTAVIVLFVCVTVGGILAYGSIPKEAQPEIEIPTIAVNTQYPGVSPSDIETLVTRPLEEELNTISDVTELRSTSVEGYSSITVEFATSVDMDQALQKVREKVDLAKPELPSAAEEPTIYEFNLSEFPVMQVNVAGEYGLVRLKEIGEELKDRLEQIPSVLRVDLRGGLEREVQVELDLSRLKFYDLAIDDVIEAIQDENVNIPGGSIDVGSRKYLVRVDGEFPDPELIADLVVATRGGRPIYVRDIADVEFGFADRESFARLDGSPVVTLDVVKRSGENIIATAEAVKGTISRMEPLFPPTTVVKITSDQSDDIHRMVSTLENNIISGLILIIAVLLFFLGVRNSVFVAISIPTSMLLSFLVLEMVGVTMNMVVLFSLILALGLLVDNAIVVVENIYRYVEEGWDRGLAAKKATGEVAMPVIGATATTLGAFIPLMFWPGIVGEFMKFLPLTLIITLASSLFVALVIVPTLCALFMRVEEGVSPRRVGGGDGAPGAPVGSGAAAGSAGAGAGGGRGEPAGAAAGGRAGDGGPPAPRQPPALTRMGRWTLGGLAGVLLVGVAAANPLTALLLAATVGLLYALHRFLLDRMGRAFRERWMPWMVIRYEAGLRWALDHRGLLLFGSAGAFVATVMAFAVFNHGVEFFPEDIPPQQAWVSIRTPVGSRAEHTDEIARGLEGELRTEVPGLGPNLESVVTTVGGGGGGGAGRFAGGGPTGPDEGRITASFVEYRERTRDSFGLLADMQGRLGDDVAGAEISVEKPQQGPPTGAPVSIEIVGEDPLVLRRLSDRVLEVLRNAPVGGKLEGLESNLDEGRPELSVRVDREKASLYSLSTRKVGMAVRGAIQGIEAGTYRTADDEYDIVVRLAEPYRKDLSSLEDLVVTADGPRGKTQVPIVTVADWDVEEGYASIQRRDMDRVATITSDVATGYNSNAVLAEVRETLSELTRDLPAGYTVRYTGQSEEQEEARRFLSSAFLIALMLIGFILVAQFNSVATPVIILTSVVMSTVGVLLGLLTFNMPFVIIMTGVGIISLAGIVVNNAIVLIDYIEILQERDGLGRRESLVQGGKTRFRPVVLTALTTALGLVPLSIGLNFDFFGLYRSLAPDLYWGGEQAAWWGPMAVAVIVGIVFATFLTLVLVPVMYSLVDDVARFVRRHFVPAEAPTEAPAVPPEIAARGREPEPAGDGRAAASRPG